MIPILINPKLLINKHDKFTTGIVYMPITLAYINSIFIKNNIQTYICDLFSLNPKMITKNGKFLELGLNINDESIKFPEEKKIFYIFANQIINHDNIISNIKFLKKNYPESKVVVVENSQAVTAYSLRKVKDIFFDVGVDYLVFGEPEYPCEEIYIATKENRGINTELNIITKINEKEDIKIRYNYNLDQLPLPNWDGFNLENYWTLLPGWRE